LLLKIGQIQISFPRYFRPYEITSDYSGEISFLDAFAACFSARSFPTHVVQNCGAPFRRLRSPIRDRSLLRVHVKRGSLVCPPFFSLLRLIGEAKTPHDVSRHELLAAFLARARSQKLGLDKSSG